MPLYGKLPCNLFGGEVAGDSFAIDFLSDTINVALTTSTHVPNQDTHETFADITNEVVGTGYTAGGMALASKTVVYTAASNLTTLDAADTTWSSSTITARNLHVYKSTGTPSTSPLILYETFGSDQSSSAGNFTIAWNASGILTFTVS